MRQTERASQRAWEAGGRRGPGAGCARLAPTRWGLQAEVCVKDDGGALALDGQLLPGVRQQGGCVRRGHYRAE